MPFSDSKVFRYRYEFAEKPLKDFIRERYFRNQEQPDLREVIAQRVRLNGHPVHNGTVVAKGDWIEYLHLRRDEEERNIHLTVLYEDEWIIAISKPDFLPVIPNTQFYYNSLAILVKERFNDREISPIHRLDIETSGVLLFGKAKKARREMQLLFQEKKIEKRYQAVVFGAPNVNSIAGNLIPAKKSRIHTKLELEPSDKPNSLTLIEKQKAWGDCFRLWLKPITGKTNQIR
ncbi:MAG: hypothetical protein GY866_42745, partial [Proteobacteria bacterium]|nr:hypothetical protein [Pseudomonadota bacterium]